MLKRIGFFVIFLSAVSLLCSAQAPQGGIREPQASTNPRAAPLTTLLKKTVVFLRVGYLKDGEPLVAAGTGFFVFYEDKRLGERRGFIYLVTNRHMATPGIEQGRAYPVQWARIRMNLRQTDHAPESEDLEIPLGPQLQWRFPADESVDLAVIQCLPDQVRYDYIPFPVSLFATHDVVDAQNIVEGDSILFTGYFYQFPGLKKFEPIVRHGILAMIPDEKLNTTLNKPGRLYLADVHVYGGNSGSPLFVNLSGFRNNGIVAGPGFRLLGIISGYYHEDSKLKLTVATTLDGTLEQNSGIAMVVPVDELKTLLDSPALQAARDAAVAVKDARRQP